MLAQRFLNLLQFTPQTGYVPCITCGGPQDRWSVPVQERFVQVFVLVGAAGCHASGMGEVSPAPAWAGLSAEVRAALGTDEFSVRCYVSVNELCFLYIDCHLHIDVLSWICRAL